MDRSRQVTKGKERFGLDHVVLVVGLQPTGLTRGDRGMITQTRISEDIKPAGLDWITASRASWAFSPRACPVGIKALVEGGALQMSLFTPAPAKAGDRDMAGITPPHCPAQPLIVC